MKSILDPSFRYTKSINTDIRKTFTRIRKEQQNAKAQIAQPASACEPLDQARGACAGAPVVLLGGPRVRSARGHQ